MCSNSAEEIFKVYEAPEKAHETLGRCAGPAHQQLPHLKEPLLCTPAVATPIRHLTRSLSLSGYKELHMGTHRGLRICWE